MYKEIGPCKLYCDDSYEILSKIKNVDLVVTDPPYGVNIAVGKKWDKNHEIKWVDNVYDCLTPKGAVISFASKKFTYELETKLRERLKFHSKYVWVKNAAGFPYSKNFPRTQHEDILAFTKDEDYYFDRYSTGQSIEWFKSGDNGITTTFQTGRRGSNRSKGTKTLTTVLEGKVKSTLPKSERTKHPSQKPVNVIKQLVRAYAPEDAIVLDPFMGSGSTAIACLNTGRKFIGIEKDPEYFEMTCERIQKHMEAL